MDRVSILSLVVGLLLPLLTAAVTKASYPEYAKQLLLALLSAANGVGIGLEHGGAPSVIAANALTAFTAAVAVSAGTWKPTGLIARLEAVFVHDEPPPVQPTGVST